MKSRLRYLAPLAALLLTSAASHNGERKGLLNVRITSAVGREVRVTVTLRNAYADTNRSVFRPVIEFFTPQIALMNQGMKRLQPFGTITVSTPADFVIYPHKSILDVVADSGEVAVVVTGPRGFPPVRGKGSAVEVRSAFGRVAIGHGGPNKPIGANQLSDVELAEGWESLFDGKSFIGWHGLGFKDVPSGHWVVEDGAIVRSAGGKPLDEMDLVTDSTYQNFELTWQWKISEAGNSGLKYNVSEQLSAARGSHSAMGWEYQMNDDEKNEDNKLASHRSGALFDVLAPTGSKFLNPAGRWNTGLLVFRGNHGEHWLNGFKILEYDLGTAAFDSAFAKSKYKGYPAWFAVRRAGQIALQDHGDAVWFRAIKIRVIQ